MSQKGWWSFTGQYDATRDRVWIAEHNGKMVGFLLLMHRGEAAQVAVIMCWSLPIVELAWAKN